MRTRSNPASRLLSVALCICMILALLPALPMAAEAATSGKLYLKPFDGWFSDNARFAAYFFGNGEIWVSMTDFDGDKILECDIPSGFTNVIFCRMNGQQPDNNWNNKWNQTADLTIPSNGNTLYTMPNSAWDGSSNASSNWSRPSCGYVGHEDAKTCRFCGEKQIDIYFENNWNWSDIRLYYWYSDNRLVPSVPGQRMTYYGNANGKNYYRMKIPTDIAGFIINGEKDDHSGRDQTPDITSGWYDGITYYMQFNDGNSCGSFGFCEAFTEGHLPPEPVSGYAATCVKDGKTDGTKCPRCGVMLTEQQVIKAQGHVFDENGNCKNCETSKIRIFFENNWFWENIHLYCWYDGVAADPDWPGASMEYYNTTVNDYDETYDYYVLSIPSDVDGIIINGTDTSPDKPEEERAQQTPDISGSQLYDGMAIYMEWDPVSGNQYGSFDITEDFPCALGHTEETVSGYDATCTTDGLTNGVKCAVCDVPLTEQKTIPAPGHCDEDKNGLCDACGCAMQDAYLVKTSASLEGNIAVNYFMVLSDAVLNDETAYMQFIVKGGDPIKVPVGQAQPIGGYYMFTCEVNAKEMAENIVSQFFYEGGSTAEHRYNVRTYGEHILGDPKYDNEVTKNLITSMLNYGTASQNYFGYKTDDLAGTGVTDTPDYSTVDINGFSFTRGQGTQKVKLYSASLILNSETTLRLFFESKITATYQGQPIEVQSRSGMYYVDIVGIAAKDLDEAVTITINDGTEEADVTFNPMAYCQIVQKDTSGTFNAQMKDLACALYLYNQAANDYFE